ncbi:diacylglycerol O-acyltransferase [Oopsacas minuta]|uniref:Diacylglycerol O-acyltransferase n=1 Tax=Oopsacas minuta TaxID=111878 RepID=A0AAV7K0S5_9METZ|nr:diacylglycerol O-acyltransferase [Oopsacas minuta]
MELLTILLKILLYIPLLLINIIMLLNYCLYVGYIRCVQCILDVTYNRNIPVGEEHKRLRLLANIIHDAYNFHVGDASNSHMVGLVLFKMKGHISLHEMKTLIRDRIVMAKDSKGRLQFSNFKQIVKYKFFLPTWFPATDYNIDDHVVEIQLDDLGKPSLQEYISKQYTEGMSFDKPLWKFYLILNGEDDDSFHILMAGHHCGADGFSFLNIWINYLSDSKAELMTGQKKLAISGSFNTTYQQFLMGLITLFVSPIYMTDECIRFTRPFHKLFLNNGNGRKLSAWDTSLDFEKVRFIKNQTKTKVNDVFMAILTQALEKYSLNNGKMDRTNAYLGMGMLKNEYDSISMSNDNHKGVIIQIPLATKGFHQQLQQISFEMNNLKNSVYPFFVENCVFQMTALPLPLKLRLPLMKLTGPTVGNFANLPGPKNQLFIGGRVISDVSIFVPQSGNQTLGICFLTYAGKLSVAVHVDTANFPDAGDICEVIKETLDDVYMKLSESTSI